MEPRYRGISQYVEGLIRGLAEQAGVELFVVLNGKNEPKTREIARDLGDVIPRSHVLVFYPVSGNTAPDGLGYWLTQQLYYDLVTRVSPDVFILGAAFESAIVPPVGQIGRHCLTATVQYDLIPFADQKRYLPNEAAMKSYLHCLRITGESDLLLCISEYTAREARKVFPYIPACTVWGGAFEADITASKRKNFIFYCGGLDPRKNVPFLIKAYAKQKPELRKRHPLFVCCRDKNGGQARDLRRLINSTDAKDDIVLVEAENNQALARFYSECWLFITPSLSEGLGLPAIEALTFGAPVLTSNAKALPEVCTLTEAQFDPTNLSELSDKIRQADEDPVFYGKLCAYAQENQTRFSWKNTASRAVDEFAKRIPEKSKRLQRSEVEDIDLLPFEFAGAEKEQYLESWVKQRTITLYVDISQDRHTSSVSNATSLADAFLQYARQCLAGKNVEIVFVAGGADLDGYYRVAQDQDKTWKIIGRCLPAKGDIYLSWDSCWQEHQLHRETLRHWKELGVVIFTVLTDLYWIRFPEFAESLNEAYRKDQWLLGTLAVTDAYLCIGSTVASDFSHWIKENGDESPDPLVVTCPVGYEPLNVGGKCERQSGKAAEPIRILCEGAVEPRHGYLSLLGAFERVLDSGINAELVVVGKEGRNGKEIAERLTGNKYAGTKIIWEKDASEERILEWYSKADCAVCASYHDSLGTTVRHAAEFSLPLLLRAIPLYRELSDGRALFFTDDTLVSVLTDALSEKRMSPVSSPIPAVSAREAVSSLLDSCLALAGGSLGCAQKNIEDRGTMEARKYLMRERVLSDSADAYISKETLSVAGKKGNQPKAASGTDRYWFKSTKYALMRKCALSKAKRNHYDRRWREIRQEHFASVPQGVPAHALWTLRYKKAKYALLRCCALSGRSRDRYDQKWRELRRKWQLMQEDGNDSRKSVPAAPRKEISTALKSDFGLLKGTEKLALFGTLPPHQSGIAHYNEKLYLECGDMAMFTAPECVRQDAKTFDYRCYDYVRQRCSFQGCIYVLGNSWHNLCALRAALEKKGGEKACFYLHEAQISGVWDAYCRELGIQTEDFYARYYRGKGSRLGVLPLVRLTGISDFIVNNEKCREMICQELESEGIDNARVQMAFLPIESRGAGKSQEPHEGLLVGTFGIPHTAKASERVIDAVRILSNRGIRGGGTARHGGLWRAELFCRASARRVCFALRRTGRREACRTHGIRRRCGSATRSVARRKLGMYLSTLGNEEKDRLNPGLCSWVGKVLCHGNRTGCERAGAGGCDRGVLERTGAEYGLLPIFLCRAGRQTFKNHSGPLRNIFRSALSQDTKRHSCEF